MVFSKKLQKLMRDRSWDAVQLAAAVSSMGGSIHPVTIQRWLDDGRTPHSASIYIVAKALNVAPSELMINPKTRKDG